MENSSSVQSPSLSIETAERERRQAALSHLILAEKPPLLIGPSLHRTLLGEIRLAYYHRRSCPPSQPSSSSAALLSPPNSPPNSDSLIPIILKVYHVDIFSASQSTFHNGQLIPTPEDPFSELLVMAALTEEAWTRRNDEGGKFDVLEDDQPFSEAEADADAKGERSDQSNFSASSLSSISLPPAVLATWGLHDHLVHLFALWYDEEGKYWVAAMEYAEAGELFAILATQNEKGDGTRMEHKYTTDQNCRSKQNPKNSGAFISLTNHPVTKATNDPLSTVTENSAGDDQVPHYGDNPSTIPRPPVHSSSSSSVSLPSHFPSLSFPNIASISYGLLLGIHGLHSVGIAHRDLSLENCLIDSLGNLKICDFGVSIVGTAPVTATMHRISRLKSDEFKRIASHHHNQNQLSENSKDLMKVENTDAEVDSASIVLGGNCIEGSDLNASNVIRASVQPSRVGKVKYVSPELFYNEDYNPFLQDVWSFGVILFVLLTSCFPFEIPSADDPRLLLLCSGNINQLLALWNLPLFDSITVDFFSRIFCPPLQRWTVAALLMHPLIKNRYRFYYTKKKNDNICHKKRADQWAIKEYLFQEFMRYKLAGLVHSTVNTSGPNRLRRISSNRSSSKTKSDNCLTDSFNSPIQLASTSPYSTPRLIDTKRDVFPSQGTPEPVNALRTGGGVLDNHSTTTNSTVSPNNGNHNFTSVHSPTNHDYSLNHHQHSSFDAERHSSINDGDGALHLLHPNYQILSKTTHHLPTLTPNKNPNIDTNNSRNVRHSDLGDGSGSMNDSDRPLFSLSSGDTSDHASNSSHHDHPIDLSFIASDRYPIPLSDFAPSPSICRTKTLILPNYFPSNNRIAPMVALH